MVLAETEANRQNGFPGCVDRERANRADGAQGGVVKQAVTTALLYSRTDDMAAFVDDQQDQGFAFKALGDGFGRIEVARLMKFLQVLAYRSGPVDLRSRLSGG